jgi:hypothetical protein
LLKLARFGSLLFIRFLLFKPFAFRGIEFAREIIDLILEGDYFSGGNLFARCFFQPPAVILLGGKLSPKDIAIFLRLIQGIL